MSYLNTNSANVIVDHDLRNALIRTNIALLQREIREKKNWYTSRRVVVRKRNGRIHLSRLGSRKQTEYVPVDFEEEEDSQDTSSFTLVDETSSSRSASFSSNY
ncbi:uncharacterized protein F4812DRAFT_454010 [Daldinia caldariorum]|uniref:uncharacterized protein n=1 Tax=Daldinia caldariorum TaxID=326644 RepID=UPI0020078AC4|nr:uncharacterized protein F4812DRAFT_454010 [Daldinia caldariorum]KAI1472200.1 hypothetical protein F4812DRAFT_454010 [Daldinia caldariorum]